MTEPKTNQLHQEISPNNQEIAEIIEPQFQVFNHSSESMSEIPDGSVDVVVTDPPWNMGVQFGEFLDERTDEHYQAFLVKVIQELKRVLKDDGICVVVSADRVRHEGKSVDLSDLYQSLFTSQGLYLINSTQANFVESEGAEWGAIPLSQWDDKTQAEWAYSQEGRFQVFAKNKDKKLEKTPQEKTHFYGPIQGHPCPFGQEMVSDLVSTFWQPNKNLLDPFMGIASLGEEVLKRGGSFYGYELDKNYFETAKNKLEKAKETR